MFPITGTVRERRVRRNPVTCSHVLNWINSALYHQHERHIMSADNDSMHKAGREHGNEWLWLGTIREARLLYG